MKPIILSTDSVRAIIDGGKTTMRQFCRISSSGRTIQHYMCKKVEYPAKNIGGICAQFYDENDHYKGAARPYFILKRVIATPLTE